MNENLVLVTQMASLPTSDCSCGPHDPVCVQQLTVNRLELAVDELSGELQIARSTLHAAELENNASRVQEFLKSITELQDRRQAAERCLLVAEEHLVVLVKGRTALADERTALARERAALASERAALAREWAAVEKRRALVDQHNVAAELQRVEDTRTQNHDTTGTFVCIAPLALPLDQYFSAEKFISCCLSVFVFSPAIFIIPLLFLLLFLPFCISNPISLSLSL
jgi:hypothetical protein